MNTNNQLKRVHANEYVTTSAIWEQLNIFFIICKCIMFQSAQGQQHNAETKPLSIIATLYCWPREYLKTDLGFRLWDTINSLLERYLLLSAFA